MSIRAIITGATGMVGEGVLHECLQSPEVETVLVIGRRTCSVKHEKMNEIILEDLFELAQIHDQLKGYNACYFCAGTSSVRKSEEEYTRITYDLTINFARTLVELNPDMTFCYVSGTGTDSSEKGRIMWARVKGKTENDLMKLPFKSVYNFRPGYIQPTQGMINTYKIYKVFTPLYPILKTLFSKYVVSLEDIGRSMIRVTNSGYEKKILECNDIRMVSEKLNK